MVYMELHCLSEMLYCVGLRPSMVVIIRRSLSERVLCKSNTHSCRNATEEPIAFINKCMYTCTHGASAKRSDSANTHPMCRHNRVTFLNPCQLHCLTFGVFFGESEPMTVGFLLRGDVLSFCITRLLLADSDSGKGLLHTHAVYMAHISSTCITVDLLSCICTYVSMQTWL